MNIVPGAQFRDCSNGDMEHYFLRTLLLWNLSPTKKRIFMCDSIMGNEIKGQYLTRQLELKEKSFALNNWWQSLDVIPPYGITFSLGKCAAIWYPSMAKYLKKSFPNLDSTSSGTFLILGVPKAGEVTVQNIMASAFGKYYSSYSTPDLREALQLEGHSAVAAKEGFAVNFQKGDVHFKNSIIGTLNATRDIRVKNPFAKEMLVDIGHVQPEKVVVHES